MTVDQVVAELLALGLGAHLQVFPGGPYGCRPWVVLQVTEGLAELPVKTFRAASLDTVVRRAARWLSERRR